jgi:hypothetical protein
MKPVGLKSIVIHVKYIVTCGSVTVDGVWIGEWIYLPLIHASQNYK